MAKRSNRRSAANRRAEIFRSANGVKMEMLEARLLLSAAKPALANPPVPPPPLPTAPEPLQGVVGTPLSLSPYLFDQAFGFNDIYFDLNNNITRGNGAGQTIAIVDAYANPDIATDLQTFDQQWGLSSNDAEGNFALTVQPLAPTVNTAIGTLADQQGWAEEEALDVEWAHVVAPGAHILLVEAPSDTLLDLLEADVYGAAQTGVVTVSDSWGIGNATINEPDNYDGFLVTPTGHEDSTGGQGDVAFFAASGDTGGLEWPSTSANVISVGGMTIDMNINGEVEDIGTWGGSGGGSDPNYVTKYNVPLVSLDANPATGVWIYDQYDYANGYFASQGEASNPWQVVGGTSLATPAWAAYAAIIDQGLGMEGIGSFDTDTLWNWVLTANESSFDNAVATFDTFWTYPKVTSYPLWPKTGPMPDETVTPNNGHSGWGFPEASGFAGYVVDMEYLENYCGILDPGVTPPPAIAPTPITGSPPAVTVIDSDGDAAFGTYADYSTTVINGPVDIGSFVSVDNLAFSMEPSDISAGQVEPTIQVVANSIFGGTDTTFTDETITLSVDGTPVDGGKLLGTATATAVNGVATFSDISFNTEGYYTIDATAQVGGTVQATPVESFQFFVSPGPATKLAIIQEPSAAFQFGIISPDFSADAEDVYGNLATGFESEASLVIASGPAGGVISGPTTANVVNGIADFQNLSMSEPGIYVLEVLDAPLRPVFSSSFQIVAIPVEERFSINGIPLSQSQMTQQQVRNAPYYTNSVPMFLPAGTAAVDYSASPAGASASSSVNSSIFSSQTWAASNDASVLDSTSGGSEIDSLLKGD